VFLKNSCKSLIFIGSQRAQLRGGEVAEVEDFELGLRGKSESLDAKFAEGAEFRKVER
jgi:hypothetical protein